MSELGQSDDLIHAASAATSRSGGLPIFYHARLLLRRAVPAGSGASLPQAVRGGPRRGPVRSGRRR